MGTLALPTAARAQAPDADDDGVPDSEEREFYDTDADGLQNYLDPDDDGDTRSTRAENAGARPDRDRDGVPDYLDGDEDDDGLIILAEDIDGDHLLTSADDTDSDGLIDALDADDDGDGVPTGYELASPGVPRDTDHDGRADHRDADDDGDGVATATERRYAPNYDGDHDGVPAYLDADEQGLLAADSDSDGLIDDVDPDDDGDRVLDVDERVGDSDGDGITDALDPDDDGDGVETRREYSVPQLDTDADGTPDYLDIDDDGDQIETKDEAPDPNHDGSADDARRTHDDIADYLAADDDGDWVPTRDERPEGKDRDSDRDGVPDHLDGDDDGDGVDSYVENANGSTRDTDHDGVVDYLDADDDGDGLSSQVECSLVPDSDVDRDDVPNCYDLDSDGDGAPDGLEGLLDTDDDGVPDYLDATVTPKDSDRDGVADEHECESRLMGCADIDADGKPDYLDDDDDGDGVSTLREEGQRGRDSDGDGTPDYLDDDDDDDGILTKLELGLGQRARDSDRDGTPDYLDADDDGDGKLTRTEGGDGADADADGVPDYLDPASSGPLDAGTAQEGGIAVRGDASDDGGTPTLTVRQQQADGGCSVAGARSPRSALSFLFVLSLAAVLRRRRGWPLVLLAALGCADDEPSDKVSLDRDGGGGGLDAGADASRDARVDMDAQIPSCMSGMLRFEMGDSPARSFSAVMNDNRIHLAFIAPACGGATSYGQGKGVRYVNFSTSTADAGVPLDVDQDMCLPVREPTLVLHGEQAQVSLYLGSNRGGNYDLYLTDPTQSSPMLMQQSDDALLEVALSGAALGATSTPFLAYVPEAQLPSAGAAPIALLDGADLVPLNLGHRATQLTLVRREDGANKGLGVLGWVSDREQTAGAYLRTVSEVGAPTGDVLTLSRNVGPNSQVAIAARSNGTGIVYTETPGVPSHQLRYRALSTSGVLAEPRLLTSGSQDVLQFAVAPYRNGFVVVYRNREPDGSVSLRIISFDLQGNPASNGLLRSSATGTGLQLMLGLDGRLMVLWDEPGPTPEDGSVASFDRSLNVARIDCF